MWCIQAITEEYRTRMYRLLDLYQQAYDPNLPLVCMDEKSKQLLEDSRQPILAKPGQLEKYDYEYKRKGTCNIFIAVAPKAGMRVVKVTDTRKKEDFAYFVEDLIENHFPKASCIQLVLDCVFRSILYQHSAAKFTSVPGETLPSIPLESLPLIPG